MVLYVVEGIFPSNHCLAPEKTKAAVVWLYFLFAYELTS